MNFNIDNRTPAHLNSSFNSFYSILFEIFNSLVSKKCKTKRLGSYAPWMTPGLWFCIYKKYRLLKQVNFDRLSRNKFNEYNSILKITIKQAKELFYYQKFMQNNGNVKKIWSLVNNLLRRNKEHLNRKKTKLS